MLQIYDKGTTNLIGVLKYKYYIQTSNKHINITYLRLKMLKSLFSENISAGGEYLRILLDYRCKNTSCLLSIIFNPRIDWINETN